MNDEDNLYFETYLEYSLSFPESKKEILHEKCKIEEEWLPLAWKVKSRKLKFLRKLDLYTNALQAIRQRMEMIAAFSIKHEFRFRFYPLIVIIHSKGDEWNFDYTKTTIKLRHTNRRGEGVHLQKKFSKVIFALYYILEHDKFLYCNDGDVVHKYLK